VGQRLGVRVGDQLDALVGQLRAQQLGVFQDAVVDGGDAPRGVDVRVRGGLVRWPVRGPAGVRDARAAALRGRTDAIA